MPGPIQSVERAAAILRLFASGSTGGRTRLGVTELSRALDLPKGTVHGLLRTLQRVGFVEQDSASGKYQLGAALNGLGADGPDPNELRAVALAGADSLAVRSGESVRIGMLHGGRVLVVGHVFRPDNSVQVLEVGARLPLHASALGKVLAAYDPLAAQVCAGSELRACTGRTITTRRALRAELASLRRRGWGAEVEELMPGTAAFAAPLRGRQGIPVGAIGITGAVERLYVAGSARMDLVSQVREAARSVSRRLRDGRC
jgi:DNA-binding IclR family transcriptional regulator